MSSDRQSVYWDSCVTLGWLNGDVGAERTAAIAECLKDVAAGRLVIVTSELLFHGEILDAKMSDDARTALNSVVVTRGFQLLPHGKPAQDLMREIRNYYAARGEKVPDLADALHLATAVHWNVGAFYTLDEGKKGGRSLLGLNGNVAGHDLKIVEPPPPPQRRFDF